jgi:hypothetical protein
MTNIVSTDTAQRFVVVQSGVANVTGNGTVYTYVYNTLSQGSGIVIATGVFTCTVAGVFLFCNYPSFSNTNSSMTNAICNLVTTQRTFTFANYNVGAIRSQAVVSSIAGYVIAPMAAGDTATVTLQISGSTQVAGVFGWCQATRLF